MADQRERSGVSGRGLNIDRTNIVRRLVEERAANSFASCFAASPYPIELRFARGQIRFTQPLQKRSHPDLRPHPFDIHAYRNCS